MSETPYFPAPEDFHDGLAVIKVDNKWGYIDKTGKYIIEPRFVTAWNFSEGLAIAELGGKLGYIDRTGEFVIKPQFAAAWHFSEGLAAVKCSEPRKPSEFDRLFAELQAEVERQRRAPREGQPVPDGTETAEPSGSTYPASDGTAHDIPDMPTGRWGYIDKVGEFVVNPQFHDARGFSDELAAVKVGGEKTGKWGYIDKTGKLVIVPRFDDVLPFSEGLAAIRVGDDETGGWGYVDKSDRQVTAAKFQSAWSFSGGLALVKIDDRYGYVDKAGDYAIEPQTDYAEVSRRLEQLRKSG